MQNIIGKALSSVSKKQYILSAIYQENDEWVTFRDSTETVLIKLFYIRSVSQAEMVLKKIERLMSYDFPPRFSKPIDIIALRDERNELYCFGYITPIIANCIPLNQFLIQKTDVSMNQWYNLDSGGLQKRLVLAFQIALNFHNLHRQNKAYSDISGINIVVSGDEKNIVVWMTDLETLYQPGNEKRDCFGSPRYMAPEVVKNQLPPDSISDDYSLAVIVYELLKTGHPYVGDFVIEHSSRILETSYLGFAPYVDDEDNSLNKSTSAQKTNVVFSPKIKSIFNQMFVQAKTSRVFRPTAKEIAIATLEASNSLIHCEKCGAWYFPFFEFISKRKYICPWCLETNPIPPLLLFFEKFPQFKGEEMVVSPSKKRSSTRVKKTFILDQYSRNNITLNYFRLDISENDIATENTQYDSAGNIKCAFIIDFDSNQQPYLYNASPNVVYIRKEGMGPFLPIEFEQKRKLGVNDTIHLEDEQYWIHDVEFSDLSKHFSNCDANVRIFARFL